MAFPPVLLCITWRMQLGVFSQVDITMQRWTSCDVGMHCLEAFCQHVFYREIVVKKIVQTANDTYTGLVVLYIIIFSSIAAVIQSRKALPGLPLCSGEPLCEEWSNSLYGAISTYFWPVCW